jgi:hypothetical protein
MRSIRELPHKAPASRPNCAEGDVRAASPVDAQCDSSPDSGDGACDACAVGLGVTTDNEMFLWADSYSQQFGRA